MQDLCKYEDQNGYDNKRIDKPDKIELFFAGTFMLLPLRFFTKTIHNAQTESEQERSNGKTISS